MEDLLCYIWKINSNQPVCSFGMKENLWHSYGKPSSIVQFCRNFLKIVPILDLVLMDIDWDVALSFWSPVWLDLWAYFIYWELTLSLHMVLRPCMLQVTLWSHELSSVNHVHLRTKPQCRKSPIDRCALIAFFMMRLTLDSVQILYKTITVSSSIIHVLPLSLLIQTFKMKWWLLCH